MKNSLTLFAFVALFLSVSCLAHAGWEEGVAAYKSRDYSKAAQEFKGIVEAQPDFAAGQYMLGQSLLKSNQKQAALAPLKKAYSLEPTKIPHQFALGKAYLDNGKYTEASQILGKINPASLPKGQESAYQQMLAVALEKSGKSGQAVAALKKSAEASPNDADAWYRYGTSAFNANETRAAIVALEKAARLDANDAKKKETLVKALIRSARETRDPNAKKAVYGKAIPVSKALTAQRGTYENHLTLGELYLGTRQYNQAVASFKTASSKNSSDFYAPFYIAQAYTALSRWRPAETSARQSLQLAPNDKSKRLAWRQIGFVNEKLKNFPEAKVAYTNAGDTTGVRRVEENERIAKENAEADKHNREILELEKEQKALEKELKELQGGSPPRR